MGWVLLAALVFFVPPIRRLVFGGLVLATGMLLFVGAVGFFGFMFLVSRIFGRKMAENSGQRVQFGKYVSWPKRSAPLRGDVIDVTATEIRPQEIKQVHS